MSQSFVYELKSFYGRRAGRLVRRLLLSHIREIWPDIRGMRLLGYGYATPYLNGVRDETERTVAMMPSVTGVHVWPQNNNGEKKKRPAADAGKETTDLD